MNNSASQYLQEVKKRIHCSHSLKTEFLCQLEAEVIYYCEDHDNVNFSVLSEHFGTPDDIANDFLSELGMGVNSNANKPKQYVLYLAVALLFIIIAWTAIGEIYTNYKQQQALDIYYIEEITFEGDVAPYATDPVYLAETFG